MSASFSSWSLHQWPPRAARRRRAEDEEFDVVDVVVEAIDGFLALFSSSPRHQDTSACSSESMELLSCLCSLLVHSSEGSRDSAIWEEEGRFEWREKERKREREKKRNKKKITFFARFLRLEKGGRAPAAARAAALKAKEMEPFLLPQLRSLLDQLQLKLSQTASNSKRFKLGLKIDKCRAMIERREATTAKKKKTSTSTTSTSQPFSSIIAAPPRPTAAELSRRASRFERDELEQKKRPGADVTLRDARRKAEKSSSAAVAAASSCAAVFGKSEALEKAYLRLTSLPTVAEVRPPRVLAEALALLKEIWRERAGKEKDDAARYYTSYLREQLKSLRQDLVVQSVRGPLAVDAYETHARVALEARDAAEFRQCQAWFPSPIFFCFFSLFNCDAPSMIVSLLHVH